MPQIPSKDNMPTSLKPYIFHGVKLKWSDLSKPAIGDCPFCGKESKLSVNIATSQFRCFSCNEGPESDKVIKGGNSRWFMNRIYELSEEATTVEMSEALRKDRKYLYSETVDEWGIVKSIINGDWLVGGYRLERTPKDTEPKPPKLMQVYRYTLLKGSDGVYHNRWLPTPEMGGHQLYIPHIGYDHSKPIVDILEGIWDAAAWYEILRRVKLIDKTITMTANPNAVMTADRNVIAVPGANTFLEPWYNLFGGKIVNLYYDNDHPRKNAVTKATIPAVGYSNMLRVAKALLESNDPPAEVNIIRWSATREYDATLPDGTDIRDVLSAGSADTLALRIPRVKDVLGKLTLAPVEVVPKASKVSQNGNGESELSILACNNYRDLIMTWRRAMHWTEGLDCALSVMLSSIASTMCVGDQLWVKILAPPSCLDGDTMIYDPVDGTDVSVQKRQEAGSPFHVYSIENGEVKIAQALPPEQYPISNMYEVTFKSGRRLRVTDGHRMWNGSEYVSLSYVREELSKSGSYRLPTISALDLLTRKQDVPHLKQIVEDYESCCSDGSYLCDGLLQFVEDIDLTTSPSLTDAQERNHDYSYSDAEESGYKRNHPVQCDPLSNCNGKNRVLSFQQKTLVQHHLTVDSYEQNVYRSSIDDNTQKSMLHPHKDLVEIEFFPQSIDENRQPRSRKESCLHELVRHVGRQQSRVECIHLNTSEHISQSYLDSNSVSSESVSERHLTQDTSLLASARNENAPLIERRSNQTYTNQLALAEPLETNLHEQPFETPVSVKGYPDVLTLTEFDVIVNIEYIGDKRYYDFHVPITENYWAEGFFHHNTGKSTLCEAVAVAKKYVYPKSTIRGFHSGFGDGGDGGEDHSLISQVNGKTLVIKDGDTLLQSPNLGQILSEARDVYDGSSRSSYRKKGVSRDQVGKRMTWILAGTNALRQIDASELGARFLDCVIMDRIDDDMEDDILMRVAHRANKNLSVETTDDMSTQQDDDMTEAMRKTGGYVEWLREHVIDTMPTIEVPHDKLLAITKLGKFTAFMRARPSKYQKDYDEREFAPRLVSVMTRLAKCIAFVLNVKEITPEVMRRATKVALDTSRGLTLSIAAYLNDRPEGSEVKTLVAELNRTDHEIRLMLRFLIGIGVVELYSVAVPHMHPKPRHRLTAKFKKLYNEVVHMDHIEIES